MNETKLYSANEVCEILGISTFTLTNWYRWEKMQIRDGIISEGRLPVPQRLKNCKGVPRRWTAKDVEALKEFKKNIVVGRLGVFGRYSNPDYKEKCKNSEETVES